MRSFPSLLVLADAGQVLHRTDGVALRVPEHHESAHLFDLERLHGQLTAVGLDGCRAGRGRVESQIRCRGRLDPRAQMEGAPCATLMA